MGINLSGGIVGNLLYGGSRESTCALKELITKMPVIKKNIVFIIQRKDIIRYESQRCHIKKFLIITKLS